MLFDRFDADTERSTNLSIAEAESDVSEHLQFAIGERYFVVVAPIATATHCVPDMVQNTIFRWGFARCSALDGTDQL